MSTFRISAQALGRITKRIEEGSMTLCYQPKVDVREEGILSRFWVQGTEIALPSWCHTIAGEISFDNLHLMISAFYRGDLPVDQIHVNGQELTIILKTRQYIGYFSNLKGLLIRRNYQDLLSVLFAESNLNPETRFVRLQPEVLQHVTHPDLIRNLHNSIRTLTNSLF